MVKFVIKAASGNMASNKTSLEAFAAFFILLLTNVIANRDCMRDVTWMYFI